MYLIYVLYLFYLNCAYYFEFMNLFNYVFIILEFVYLLFLNTVHVLIIFYH